ncbi:MAG: molybdenum transporter, periplasmic molybdate-binding protein [Betaproteobacteria bacterium]|nr:molybdenum transporter, periplasmic molybdate-binding protein [Betaproteobacteria bacterium]
MFKLGHAFLLPALLGLPPGALAQAAPFAAPAGGVPLILKVYSAGSLKAAWMELARAYQAKYGVRIDFEFGASGLLRERLEKGERADLFTSADTGHPQTLADKGLSGPMRVFTGNRLCVLAQPGVGLTGANVLDKLLDPAVRLGSSTPKADPSGDYTWAMFERAGKLKPRAYETLSKKAMQLVGGPNSARTPKVRSAYGKFMEERAVDVFVTYCTNAVQAQREVPGLVNVALPDDLSVTATYGMVVMRGAASPTAGLADFVLSGEGQKLLAAQGFAPLPPVAGKAN